MPFKSEAQIAKMSELEKQGKVKKGTVKQWLSETPNGGKGLPKRIGPAKKPGKINSTNDIRSYRKKRYGV